MSNKYVNYLWYIFKHKFFVMLECFKVGLYWRGITHDLSKLRLDELIPYVNYFAGNIKRNRDETGYYKPTDTGCPAFDFAWFLHQKRNDHHWQWWAVPIEGNGLGVSLSKPIEMSDDAMMEMVCDWRGAGRAQGTPNVKAWYIKHRSKLCLAPITRISVEVELGLITWQEARRVRLEGGD